MASGGALNIGGGEIRVEGDLRSQTGGEVNMTDPGGVLRVTGGAFLYGSGSFTQGLLLPNGGLDCNGGGFAAATTHTTRLSTTQTSGFTGALCHFGTLDVTAGAVVTGARPLRATGPTSLVGELTANSALELQALSVTGGTLESNGAMIAASVITTGGGTYRFGPSGTTVISGNLVLDQSTLTNDSASLTVLGTFFVDVNSTVTNNGTICYGGGYQENGVVNGADPVQCP